MRRFEQALDLTGRVALVTGGAKGLGAEIAAHLAQAGASVVVTDILDGAAQAVVEGLRQQGTPASFIHHDVVDEEQWEAAVAHAVATYGRLDVLVNNAGIEVPALISQCSAESFRRTMEVNVTGVFLGLKHAIRAMSPGGAAGHGGSIVNLSSAAGMIGVVAHAAYCASKGAVRLLTKAAAVECARLGLGIRVNSLHPGVVETDMGNNFVQGFVKLGLAPDLDTARRDILALHPLGRFGDVDDVAHAVHYLASDASKWVTGAELCIDGGIAAS